MHLIKDMSNEDYHNHPSWSSSQLKHAAKNIAVFKDMYINGNKPVYKNVSALQLGTWFHELVLEPHVFKPTLFESDARNPKATKAYKEMVAELGCENVITDSEMHKINLMLKGIEGYEKGDVFKILRERTLNEASIFVNAEGFDIRVRPDALDAEAGVIYDLKTSGEGASPEEFLRAVHRFDYGLSAALYVLACYRFYGKPFEFKWVVCSTKAPYETAIYTCGPELMSRGLAKVKRAFANIEAAQDKDWQVDYEPSILDSTGIVGGDSLQTTFEF